MQEESKGPNQTIVQRRGDTVRDKGSKSEELEAERR
jgi:hypothetical protein